MRTYILPKYYYSLPKKEFMERLKGATDIKRINNYQFSCYELQYLEHYYHYNPDKHLTDYGLVNKAEVEAKGWTL